MSKIAKSRVTTLLHDLRSFTELVFPRLELRSRSHCTIGEHVTLQMPLL